MAAKCPSGCSVCTSASKCSLCFRDYYMFIDNLCYDKCPERYYVDKIGQTCQSCSLGCYTCGQKGICLSCNNQTDFRQLDNVNLRCVPLVGYFDNGTNVCVKCPQGCYSCTSSQFCTACLQDNFLTANHLCSASCPSKTYIDSYTSTCQSCPYDCV